MNKQINLKLIRLFYLYVIYFFLEDLLICNILLDIKNMCFYMFMLESTFFICSLHTQVD